MPALTPPEQRAAVVAEAYTWLRTRYHHCQRVKGAGVDCVWLLIEVYRNALGIIPADFDTGYYPGEWYLHRHEEIYMEGVARYAHRVEEGRLGDVILYKVGHCVAHGAIIVSDDLIIHADRLAGQVELTERRMLEHRFHSYWSCIE